MKQRKKTEGSKSKTNTKAILKSSLFTVLRGCIWLFFWTLVICFIMAMAVSILPTVAVQIVSSIGLLATDAAWYTWVCLGIVPIVFVTGMLFAGCIKLICFCESALSLALMRHLWYQPEGDNASSGTDSE